MECTLTGCKKKGSLFLTKINESMEFNTVLVKSKFLRLPIMLLGVTTRLMYFGLI